MCRSPLHSPGSSIGAVIPRVALVLVTVGCGACQTVWTTGPVNTALPTRDEAKADLLRLHDDPRPLTRHVVILSGYHTPSIHAAGLASSLARATGADRREFLVISYVGLGSFDSVAGYVTREVERAWPNTSLSETVPVDVIGISMGGLVAR